MHFEILNVEHGFSAFAITDDGNLLVFDCGSSPSMSPTEYLYSKGFREVQQLYIMNYDEDHVRDLSNLRNYLKVNVLTANRSLSPELLSQIKSPLTRAMSSTIQMCQEYSNPVNPQYRGVDIAVLCNSYPQFKDTNNLSLLVFLRMGGLSVAIPGDLERAGWLALLQNPEVCRRLLGVNVFVASHHGRESGYCKEVFDYCKPSAAIFSDGPILYDSQQMAGIYGQHASGIKFNGQGRRVLSTRKDGTISWANIVPTF